MFPILKTAPASNAFLYCLYGVFCFVRTTKSNTGIIQQLTATPNSQDIDVSLFKFVLLDVSLEVKRQVYWLVLLPFHFDLKSKYMKTLKPTVEQMMPTEYTKASGQLVIVASFIVLPTSWVRILP